MGFSLLICPSSQFMLLMFGSVSIDYVQYIGLHGLSTEVGDTWSLGH